MRTELRDARKQLEIEEMFTAAARKLECLDAAQEDRLAEAAEKVARLSWRSYNLEQKIRVITALKSLNTGHWWWLLVRPRYRLGR